MDLQQTHNSNLQRVIRVCKNYPIIFLLAFYCVLSGYNANAQGRNLAEGLYSGIIDEDLGYLYFNADQSFVFLKTDPAQNLGHPQESVLGKKSIQGFAIGQWQKRGSFLILSFDKIRDHVADSNTLHYSSYSRQPYDSLILNIEVKTKGGRSPNPIVVGFFSVGKVNVSDSTDRLHLQLPLTYADSIVEIGKFGYKPQFFSLIPNNNIHNISIELVKENGRGFDNIYYAKPRRIKIYSKNERPLFTKIENGKVKTHLFLKKNIEAYPERKYILQLLASKIK